MGFSQFKTILWLRWRLTRNQFYRLGLVNAIISMAIVAIVIFLGFSGSLFGLVISLLKLSKAKPNSLLLFWDFVRNQ